jgi:putative ABC transport system permease protein
MARRPGIRRLFRLTSSRSSVANDIDAELAFHFDQTVAELRAEGLDANAADREARRRFGDIDGVRRRLSSIGESRVRQERRQEWWRGVAQDAAYTLRAVRREPWFVVVVVLTLALGIGANGTMFGVIDRLLLSPPAHVVDDGRLNVLHFRKPGQGGVEATRPLRSYPDFVALRDSAGAFDAAGAYMRWEVSLGRGEAAERAYAGIATADFARVVGVRPLFGRFFTADEDREGASPVVVLGEGLWRRKFGGERDVIGRTVLLGRTTYTIIGVAPRGFMGLGLSRVDAWVPVAIAAPEVIGREWRTTRNSYWLQIVAHRRPGVDVATAERLATRLHREWNRQAGESDSLARVIVAPIVPARGPNAPPQAKIAAWLGGVSLAVLLIACANVANLLLARSSRRRRELAVRVALGVGRGRLMAQLLTESLVLAVLASVAALVLTWWGGALLRATLLPDLDWSEPPVSVRIAAFTALVAIVSGILAGVAPALTASRHHVAQELRTGTREHGTRRGALRRSLVIVQASLCAALLVGAGLFIESLRRAQSTDSGFDRDRVLVASVDATIVARTDEEHAALWDRMRERVNELSGIESAALAVSTPYLASFGSSISVPGKDSIPTSRVGGPFVNAVTAEYFSTIGISIRRGRGFTSDDRFGAAPVAVISEAMARLVWPEEDAIGRCFRIENDVSRPCITVIGISENAERRTFGQSDNPQFYLHLAQRQWDPGMRYLVARTRGDASAMIPLLRRAMQGTSAALPFADVVTMRSVLDPSIAPWRLGATMFALFGALALVVAAIGLYSVLAYEVSRRTPEVGVRLALGARTSDVYRLVLRDGLAQAVAGVAVGCGIALAGSGAIGALLFRTSPREPVVYAAVAVVLLGIATLASFIPARRAARTDPVEAIRAE